MIFYHFILLKNIFGRSLPAGLTPDPLLDAVRLFFKVQFVALAPRVETPSSDENAAEQPQPEQSADELASKLEQAIPWIDALLTKSPSAAEPSRKRKVCVTLLHTWLLIKVYRVLRQPRLLSRLCHL
jgi:hypothetical protein